MLTFCIIATTSALLITARDPLEKKKESDEDFIFLTNMAYQKKW